MVNSLCLFNKVTQSNISITHFRELLVEFLIKKTTIIQNVSTSNHCLLKAGKSRCYYCYQKMSKIKGRKFAQSH